MAETDIAVVGMACRLPGADGPDEFWRLLDEGRCARVELDDASLRAAGVPEDVLRDPTYVKVAMPLRDVEHFDAGFFGLGADEAALMDPQQRIFLEICHEAFEHGGIVPGRFGGRIGVFAGCGTDTYLLHNVLEDPQLVREARMERIRRAGNDKDFLAALVSYHFDLRGPSVSVQTACSSSLVAVHQAAQSLLAGECELALAGGVSVQVPQRQGYCCRPGEPGPVLSPEGRVRAFDAAAAGTVYGSGAGVVLLRRLGDALAAGDRVLAVVAGSAVNNDGARKPGWLAPSVEGHAEVVAEALTLAGETADRVQYVEAHGTGVPLADAVEVAALTQAFGTTTGRRGFCGIGSVKANVGHLDAAAGIAGLLKTVLALGAGRLPPSLGCERPNPRIDFEQGPFRVVTAAEPWPAHEDGSRVAGVSSLGAGGTNAHVVLRSAPPATGTAVAVGQEQARRWHLLPVSGACPEAAVAAGAQLADFLDGAIPAELPAVAWTQQVGRRAFGWRAFAVGDTPEALARALRGAPFAAGVRQAPPERPAVVFLFPGGGAQHPGMGRELYEHEPAYRRAADECLDALPDDLAPRLCELLFGDRASAAHGPGLERPILSLPALFLTGYALARTLQAHGVEPDAMLGHSAGEYVAACLAGAFDAEQGMQIVLLRGRLSEEIEPGGMLVVPLPAEELGELAAAELSLAAVQAPGLCVVAGAEPALRRCAEGLAARGVECRPLRAGAVGHCHLLDPVLERFRDGLRGLDLRPAERPFVANLTGDWIAPGRTADPDHWVEHLRGTVRFSDGVATLLAGRECAFVEVGAGGGLGALVQRHQNRQEVVLSALADEQGEVPADRALLECVGRLWQAGVEPDWLAMHGGARAGHVGSGAALPRVALPTYPFQRSRHWIGPGSGGPGALRAAGGGAPAAPQRLAPDDWLRAPEFAPADLPEAVAPAAGARWLIVGGGGIASGVRQRVLAAGGTAFLATVGGGFARTAAGATFLPGDPRSVAAMLAEAAAGGRPERVLFALAAEGMAPAVLTTALLFLQQAIGRAGAAPGLRQLVLTAGATAAGGAPLHPEQAALHGLARAVPVECPGAVVRCLDLDPAAPVDGAVVTALLREVEVCDPCLVAALRGGARLAARLVPLPFPDAAPPLPAGGTCLVTGGLGALGLELAGHLALRRGARVALVSRRELPPEECWDEWLRLRGEDATGAAIARVQQLRIAGAEVAVFAADVGDLAAMASVVAAVRARLGPLHAVFHAARVLDDGPLQVRTGAQVERVLRPALAGAMVLDAVTEAEPPELLVLFGSTGGLFGIPGRCDQAAADAFLDAFAAWRSANRPGRTVAVDWGPWLAGAAPEAAAAGMAAGMDALERALQSGRPQVVVSPFEPAAVAAWLLAPTAPRRPEVLAAPPAVC